MAALARVRAKDLDMDPMEAIYYDRQASRKAAHKNKGSQRYFHGKGSRMSEKKRKMEELSDAFQREMLKSYR